MGFVFSALMEYALVNYALRGKGRRKRKLSSAQNGEQAEQEVRDNSVVMDSIDLLLVQECMYSERYRNGNGAAAKHDLVLESRGNILMVKVTNVSKCAINLI